MESIVLNSAVSRHFAGCKRFFNRENLTYIKMGWQSFASQWSIRRDEVYYTKTGDIFQIGQILLPLKRDHLDHYYANTKICCRWKRILWRCNDKITVIVIAPKLHLNKQLIVLYWTWFTKWSTSFAIVVANPSWLVKLNKK